MLKAIVTGPVQGIGFRRVTKRVADSRNLQGSVRNLANGNVEIVIVTSREILDELLQEIAQKLPQNTIETVSIALCNDALSSDGFVIL